MENKSMGILDREPGYVRRLAEYISSKEGCRVRIFTFENEAETEAYLEDGKLDILLVSQSMVTEEMKNWKKVGRLVLLNEEEGYTTKECPAVYKFQASGGLFREVMSFYDMQQEESAVIRGCRAEGLITGIYSPVKRCGKTIFSFVLASIYAEQSRCLFISLDEFCMIEELKQKENERDLADIIYLYRQNPNECAESLGSFCRFQGLEYIPPVTFPWDLRQIRTEELAGFIHWAAGEGGYERIVLDIGEGGDSPLELLDACGQIYMPVQEDTVSMEKINSFEQYMKRTGNQQLLDKVKKIRLPQIALENGRAEPENLLWGPMEAFAREFTGALD